MVTTEALKLLYKKLGGTADVDNITAISDMVDLIEDVAGGGGGASGLVVTISPVEGSETDEYSLDKTYADIKNCLDNGIIPVFKETHDIIVLGGGVIGSANEIYRIVAIGEQTPEPDNTQYFVELANSYSDLYNFVSDSTTGELIGTAEK